MSGLNEYIRLHKPRFEYLSRKVKECNPSTILAIGGGIECDYIKKVLPECKITIAGIDKYSDYQFEYLDLNSFYEIKENYDMIIACEVIEHIKTSPYMFVQHCTHHSKIVIVTTPNASALWIRARCLFGQSAWEICREHYEKDSHIEEYTIHKMCNLGNVKYITCINYFNHKGIKGKIYNFICYFLSKSLKDGIFVIYCGKNEN